MSLENMVKLMYMHFKFPIALRSYILLIGLFSAVLTVNAQTDKEQTLRTLSLQDVVLGIDKNPLLLEFDEKINASSAYVQGARSLDPPTVSAGLWMFPYGMPKKSVDGMSPENQGALMIGIEQMIMNPAKRKREQNYMKAMASVDKTMKVFDKQVMVEEAKKMYYEWIILKKKLKVLRVSEELMNLMIKSGEIAYTYNQNQLSRIYKARAELFNIQNMIIMTESEISQMNIEFNTMMNIDKSIVFDVDTNFTIQNYEVIPIDTSEILVNRSDVETVEQTIRLSKLMTALEMSKRKPDFGIQYSHMNNFGMMPNQFNLMGMITIPIAPWSSKGYKANLEGIRYEERALNRQREAIVNEAIGNVVKLQKEIANKKRQVAMYEQNLLPALEKNFSTSLIAFEHMKEDMFMTIDAWVALKMAKVEYLNVLGELLKLQAAYERQIEKQ